MRTFILLIFLSSCLLSFAGADTTTTYNPSSESGAWRNPFLAYVSDNMRAFEFRDHGKHEYSDYGMSNPEGEDIDSVEIGIEHYEDAADRSIGVRVSWDGGTSWSSQAIVFRYMTEGMDWLNATGVTDWTEDKLSNSNFVVEVEYFHSSGCFGDDVLVTMEDGSYETIRGLSKGDRIMRKDGGMQVVTKYTEHDDFPPIAFVNVTVEDGRSLIIHPDHEVVTSLNYSLTLVRDLTLEHHLLSRNGSMIQISSLDFLMLEDFTNIVVSNKLFWAEDLLVHNLVKLPYTAYLDWIPVRVTYSAPPVSAVSWLVFFFICFCAFVFVTALDLD